MRFDFFYSEFYLLIIGTNHDNCLYHKAIFLGSMVPMKNLVETLSDIFENTVPKGS